MFSAIQDSRCYLMNGGAVESFFVSEDTPVGSIIGSCVILVAHTYISQPFYFTWLSE